MLIITTWKTWLLYGLDMMTKDDCLTSIYFIACDQIKYYSSSYNTTDSRVIPTKVIWPSTADIQNYIGNPDSYREYLEAIASTPSANIGKLMMTSLSIPCYLFVGNGMGEATNRLVHVLQKHLFDAYGIGSIWLDGYIYDSDPNEYVQDDEKLKKKYREHLKHANKNLIRARTAGGTIYRDTRLHHLNSMSESEQRQYLKKHYHVEVEKLDAATVYAMMVDLFVDESEGSKGDQEIKDTIRANYKNRKKKL